MNRLFLTVLCAIGAAAVGRADEPATTTTDLNEAAATVIGSSVKEAYTIMEKAGVKLDPDLFIDGLQRFFRGELRMDLPTAESAIRSASRTTQAPSAPGGFNAAAFMANEETETQWVADKKSLPRAEVLEGGVVLQRLVEGSGEMPPKGSTVEVMYEGRLSDGREFDHTDEPFRLPLNAVVPGLALALENMREGGTYRVFIPPSMGYGSESIMDLIPGNSALDFTIKDLRIIR